MNAARRERRWGLFAGACGLLAVVATIAAVPVAASDTLQARGRPDDLSFLVSVGQSGAGQIAALALRLAGAALVIPLAWFYFAATHRRAPEHRAWVPVLATTALVVLAASTAIGFFEIGAVARDFVAHGPHTPDQATHVLREARGHGLLRAANLTNIGGSLLLGIWLSIASFEAMRVGLVTRFLGFYGVATGLATAITFPAAPALQAAWFGSLAILALGWWPGGRPAAWATGQAEPRDQLPETRGAHGHS
ncbi:MAG: hypothetical protein QOF76_5497 [Solirubrobacteraceae bacterium]|jgi:hypothetical protein|nr:hypothetical protein [Solirubrobacteraceae bacterium]